MLASKLVDVVANWSEIVPVLDGSESDVRSGTSLATPIVAGTLAHALHLVRQAEPGRVVTVQELRDALNASAVVDFSPTDWQPIPPAGQGLPADPGRLSLPILAQAQLGWGYVHAGLAPEIARRILEEDFTIPAGKEQAALVQPQYQRAREEFWAKFRDV